METMYLDQDRKVVAGTYNRTATPDGEFPRSEIIQYKLTHESVAGNQGEIQTVTSREGSIKSTSKGSGPSGSWNSVTESLTDGSLYWKSEDRSTDNVTMKSVGSISSTQRFECKVEQSNGIRLEMQNTPGGMSRSECTVPDVGKLIIEVTRQDGKTVTTVTKPDGTVDRTTVTVDENGQGHITMSDGSVRKIGENQ